MHLLKKTTRSRQDKNVRNVVHGFLDAIETCDFEAAARFLASERFTYRGPIANFDDAERFIAEASRIGSILKRFNRRKLFVDGTEVCVILDVLTTLPELANVRMAQWITVEADKISCIEVFFDTHAYASMFVADSVDLSK